MTSEAAVCRVAVVDHGRLFAEALADLLGTVPSLEAAATDADVPDREVLGPADVVLLGWSMRPGRSLTALLDAVRAVSPDAPVVLIVDELGPDASAAVAQSMVAGWLSRQAALATVVQAVHDARSGLPVRCDRQPRRAREALGPGLSDLTARELDVLGVVAEGLDNEAAGERLGISPHTVRTHLQNVLAKLGVSSRQRAVALVRQAGLLPIEATDG